jgi:LacI family transcriptional regulator
MTTIKDIANELNLSTATVSRALNQSRLISSDVTAKIFETAEKMGYVKRKICRSRGRAIFNIKLVLPRHKERERTLFYELTSLIEGIQSGFTKCSINLLCDTNSENFQPFPHKKGGDINGFVFAFHSPSKEVIHALKDQGTPFIILNREIPNLPCVCSDSSEGMLQIITHLLAQRTDLKPVFLSLDEFGPIGEQRLNSLHAACQKLSVPFNPETNTHIFSNIHSINPTKIESLSKQYNAFICVNDIVGTVVLSELDRLTIPVPQTISVTGFDDSPVRQLSRPLLTTVSLPVTEIARHAAARLEAQIIEFTTPPTLLKISGNLMIGEST